MHCWTMAKLLSSCLQNVCVDLLQSNTLARHKNVWFLRRFQVFQTKEDRTLAIRSALYLLLCKLLLLIFPWFITMPVIVGSFLAIVRRSSFKRLTSTKRSVVA